MNEKYPYYTWIAKSNDCAFTDKDYRKYLIKEQCYYAMRDAVLNKVEWNTEWGDFDSDNENEFIGYSIEFNPNYIKHTSYSGTYIYRIVRCDENGIIEENAWKNLNEELGIK